MKKNMMRRNLLRSVRRSIARYIAIVAIIALGAGIFVGLRTTKSDMIATGQKFMDEQNMFDLRLLSSYGWNKYDVEAVAALDGVEDAEGVISLDVIATMAGAETESVYKVYSIPERINKVYLHGGRMPAEPDECLLDGFHIGDKVLGKKISISKVNDEETIDSFSYESYTVVGYVSTPLYLDMSRGNTKLGNGTVLAYLYVPEESFTLDYYTEIALTLPGEKTVYTDAYQDLMDSEAKRLEPLVAPIADDRFQDVKLAAEEAYADGYQEYEDGLKSYHEGKAEAEKELADAEQELLDAEKELEENRKKLEKGEKELKNAQATIDKGRRDYNKGKAELETNKKLFDEEMAKNTKLLTEQQKQVEDGLKQVEAGLKEINSGLEQLESGMGQLDEQLLGVETSLTTAQNNLANAKTSLSDINNQIENAIAGGADPAVIGQLQASAASLQQNIAQLEQGILTLTQAADQLVAEKQKLQDQINVVAAQKSELESAKTTLLASKEQIDNGFVELEAVKTKTQAELQAAEAQLKEANDTLVAGQNTLNRQKKTIQDGWKALEDGQATLDEGRKEFEDAKKSADEELADGLLELQNAKLELEDARKEIDSLAAPELYLLGRNMNMGYLALENNSDIVESVSAVFPAFFLLIAALVCITTMTRMVEEERTQIGTLKSLGYSNSAIAGKYLKYAGSAAILGCGLGVIVGSVVFPLILWEAYQILMFLGDYFILKIDWPLCIMVVLAYTAVTLLVTWYCCRRSLREVPAQLIRPKPPTTGKKIFLEYLPFWNRFSFLNKVMLRNIFRYRQRLLMMLIGIGGCTALLLTGFGLRDSVGDLASYHFGEIVLYDVEVRFKDGLTDEDQDKFVSDYGDRFSDIIFYHQSSMELCYDDQVRDITFLAAEGDLNHYIDFHRDETKLAMPAKDEALISIGVAEIVGIQVGDSITVQDADMNVLDLKVSGIFDNHVYNYVVTHPGSVEGQWGEKAPVQMAAVYMADGVNIRDTSAQVSNDDTVMNVTVNMDVEHQVSKMLEALDLVVITVVICAALLAITVLYNLTNINITERIREIATIKVLGFNAKESASYVFKENIFLSVMGSAIGLVGGVFLTEFVLSRIQVDMVWIATRLDFSSYILAVVITLLSAILVDFILYFKLDKINMAEALKSVE